MFMLIGPVHDDDDDDRVYLTIAYTFWLAACLARYSASNTST